MDDHRSRLYDTGHVLTGGASPRAPRGLPCRYAGCRALFAAPGMADSMRILSEVAATRDAHELDAHGGVFRPTHVSGADRDSRRRRWASKGVATL